MLRPFRGKTAQTIGKLFMLMLAGSFVLWGIGDVFRLGGSNPVVATVGRQSILKSQLDQFAQQQLASFQQQLGGKEVPDFLRKTIERTVLQSLVQRALLLEEARAEYLAVGEAELLQTLKDQEAFRKDGKFNKAMFQEFLRYRQIDEATFLRQMKDDIVIERLVNVWQVAPQVSELQLQLLHSYHQEERKIRLATVDITAVPLPADPGDAALESWLDEHRDDYMSDEQRAFRYLLLSRGILAPGIDIPEADIARHYDENKAAYATGEQLELSQLVIGSGETDAEAVAKELRSGKSLDELRQTHPTLPERWLSLGKVNASDLPPEARDAVKGLKPGEVSEPVESEYATLIYRFQGRSEPRQQSLDEVRDSIVKQLKDEKLDDAIYAKTTEIEDQLAAGESLSAIAEKLKLPLVEVPLVTAELTPPPGQTVPKAEKLEKVAELAFTRTTEEEPTAEEIPGLGIVFIQVTDSRSAEPLPLDEVRPLALHAWQADEQSRLLKEKSAAIQKTLKTDSKTDFASFAAEHGFNAPKEVTVKRDGLSSGLSAECLNRLFADAPDSRLLLCETGPDHYALATVLEVIPARDAQPADRAKLRDETQTLYGRELFNGYLSYLEAKHGVIYQVAEPQ